ncbi:hypothetical protein AGOR_G00057740 [Albula goreensis]|uniref:CW-type domain-containing protein n=1 Tax=Albula goreensis TaxID=1534307 RepID=A0A8T3DXQ6_9TELE|nr:hypothetical protein AGOR_G00057740 [Albula goreensis]
MAAQTDRGIPLSALSPKFLHTNSTSHTWPFSAIAELIDNAYDPDVSAKQFWIDKTRIKGMDCLTFMDNGAGMSYDKMHKMLSFGFSDKQAINGHVPVGLYGNGFKSGSMRLGKDAIVFSKTRDTMCVGMLSQSYLEAIRANHVVVPIVTFARVGHNQALSEHAASLQDILRYSLFKTEAELFSELRAINATCSTGSSGTRIIIWNLRRMSTGQTEFDFNVNRYDIQIPADVYESTSEKYKRQDRPLHSVPESDYSLRAYCSILYLKPRMQIVIRGQKVKTQLISKSLAYIAKDHYRPIFLNKRIRITFGYNTKSKEQYGIMMYHKNRLIKAYERVGCQLKANNRGVGVIGVIECNFLKPTHNKQDFDYTDEYRKTMNNLGLKLEEYWNEIRYKRDREDPNCTIPVEDTMKRPDQNWVQCDNCLKWRKLPDGIDCSLLPEKWFCHMNPDPQFRSCQAEEEPEDSDDDQPSYQKTYKQQRGTDSAGILLTLALILFHERVLRFCFTQRNRLQQERNRQQMEQAKKKVEMQRIAALAQQNEALRRQHEDLKRQLKQSNFQVTVPRTTGQTQHTINNSVRGPLGGAVTNSAPHSLSSRGQTQSSSTMPIISSVCSLSTPSRMKRTLPLSSDSMEAKRARVNGLHTEAVEICPSSPVIIPDDDDDDIVIVEASSTPRPGAATFDLAKVKTEQRGEVVGEDPAGMHMECSDDAAVETSTEAAATATTSATAMETVSPSPETQSAADSVTAAAAASEAAVMVTTTTSANTTTTTATSSSPLPQQQVSTTTQTDRNHMVKDEEEESKKKEREKEGRVERDSTGNDEREEERKEGETEAEVEVEAIVVKVEREGEEEENSKGPEEEEEEEVATQMGEEPQAEGAVSENEGAEPQDCRAGVAMEMKDRLLAGAQQQQDELVELMQDVAQERDQYRAQVHQLTCQLQDLQTHLSQLTHTVVKKELCDQATETEQHQVQEEEEEQELRRLYQCAKQEVEELKREREIQEALKSEVGINCDKKEEEEEGKKGEEERKGREEEEKEKRKGSEEEEEEERKARDEEDVLALQMDSLLRELDQSNRKREELQGQLECVEQQRRCLSVQCEQLHSELHELRAASKHSENPSSAGESTLHRDTQLSTEAGDSDPTSSPSAEAGESNRTGSPNADCGGSEAAGNATAEGGALNRAGNPAAEVWTADRSSSPSTHEGLVSKPRDLSTEETKRNEPEDGDQGQSLQTGAGQQEQAHRLRTLRQNIGRLLVTFVPALDLDQVNYDCDVIDEILQQVLEEVSSSGPEQSQDLLVPSPTPTS